MAGLGPTAGQVVSDLRRLDPAGDRRIKWSARGQALDISLGADAANPDARDEFRYGPDGGRHFHKSAWRDGEVKRTERTFHAGRFEEWLPDPAASDHRSVMRTRVSDGVVHVRTIDKAGNASDAFQYVHRDHLGSAVAVTDGQGTVLRRFAHNPFGGRRKTDWTQQSLGPSERAALASDGAARSAGGFTGHPQLDRTGYINMGGRLYDPILSRFLSPDPAVADWRSSQDWNPYSYVANRPMSQVDPTGAVRAGPGCNVNGVFCLDAGGGPGAAGGFAGEASQAWTLALSLRWLVFWVPTVQIIPSSDSFGIRVSYRPFFYPLVTGSLQQVNIQSVADRHPADEPILAPGNAVSPGAGTRQRSRFVRSRISYRSSVDEMGQHDYRIRGIICQWSPQSCNEALATAVFEHVNRNDVPFTVNDLGDDFHTLPGNNPIAHQEDASNRRTTNETMEGHIFHPGMVEHRVHFGNGNNTLYYDVTGKGSGPYPHLNNFLGRRTFEPGVREVLWLYAR